MGAVDAGACQSGLGPMKKAKKTFAIRQSSDNMSHP
jgi:hypothetical protein